MGSRVFCAMMRRILANQQLPSVEEFPEEDDTVLELLFPARKGATVIINFASIIRRTEQAVLFLIDGDTEPREVWMPLSMVNIDYHHNTFVTFASFWKTKV